MKSARLADIYGQLIPQLPPQQPPDGQLGMGVDCEGADDTAKVESNLSSFSEPQCAQAFASESEKTRSSVTLPQSLHLYSYSAMLVLPSEGVGF